MEPMRFLEWNDPGVIQALKMLRLPNILRKIYAFYIRYIKRDKIYAGLVDGFHRKSGTETMKLIAERDIYKTKWAEFWDEERLDFMLTVPSALPAVPHGAMKKGWRSCGYLLLFNLVSLSIRPSGIIYVK